jgi:competence protein ComEC
MARKKKKRSSPRVLILTVVLMLFAYLFCCAADFYDLDVGFELEVPGFNVFELFAEKQSIEQDTPPLSEQGEVLFHFIDVGQGDAILVTAPGGNMLIDTSESKAREALDDYLKTAGVEEIEYLVLTHPDADHIGNADFIIQNYVIKNIIMTDYVATSKTYERLLDAIEASSANVIIGESGYRFNIGELTNTIIAPNSDYDDPNEMSIVVKSTYGETSVMLTGDAEKKSEADSLKKWSADTFKCNILKVGHHGSSSSTTEAFLNAVDPDIAVISCGSGNKYGHPHDEVIERLLAKGVEIYQTDEDGDIVFKTDGKEFVLIQPQ